jgi:methionyl aminopeptidase
MRATGEALAAALRAMKEAIVPGQTTTGDLDILAGDVLKTYGAKSALLGYKPPWTENSYLHNACISINDEVIHGVPNAKRTLREGDLVSLDMSAILDGWCADATISTIVGSRVLPKAKRINQVTRDAMYHGIAQAIPGNKMRDVSLAIQKYVEKNGMSVVRELVGHGIGRTPHEEGLDVPCFVGSDADKIILEVGMTFCVEPMVIFGKSAVVHITADPWTIVSKDRTIACHWEHTIAITENGPEILTNPVK